MQENKDSDDAVFRDWQHPELTGIVLDQQTAESSMDRVVGEAAMWPEERLVRDALVPISTVDDLAADAMEWIRRVLKIGLVPPDLAERLVAARGLLGGEDAFFVAWQIENRPMRVAVTRKRVHILSLLDNDKSPPQDTAAKIASEALSFANTVLRLPQAVAPEQLTARNFRGAVMLFSPASDIPVWHEALLLLARERTIKISMLKEMGGDDPPKAGGPGMKPTPWFPVP